MKIHFAVLALSVAVAAGLTLQAAAQEEKIQLKAGPNLAVLEQNCAACHSLDYIPMNSAFLDKAGWTAEVTKMVNVFGAPVAADDQAKIVDYLSASYGK